jgi:hypothetical protein
MLRNMGANSYTPPGPGQPFIGCVQKVGDHSLRLIEPNESCRNNEIRIQLGAVAGPAGTSPQAPLALREPLRSTAPESAQHTPMAPVTTTLCVTVT